MDLIICLLWFRDIDWAISGAFYEGWNSMIEVVKTIRFENECFEYGTSIENLLNKMQNILLRR
jgi:hypothetical protein